MAIPFVNEAVALLTGNMVRFLIFEILLVLVSAFFIWLGAKVAQVEKAGFPRSFLVAIIVAIVLPLLLIPLAGLEIISLIASVVINLVIIKLVFGTGWRKSLVTWIFSIIAGIVVDVRLEGTPRAEASGALEIDHHIAVSTSPERTPDMWACRRGFRAK